MTLLQGMAMAGLVAVVGFLALVLWDKGNTR
jgi:hypothetical protein